VPLVVCSLVLPRPPRDFDVDFRGLEPAVFVRVVFDVPLRRAMVASWMRNAAARTR
jgi:hypothetical protein